MFVEFTIKSTGEKLLVRKDMIQSVYTDDGDLIVDMGEFDRNRFAVAESYEEVRDALMES